MSFNSLQMKQVNHGFEVQDDHTFQIINMATRGPWGDDKINEAFLEIWKDILRKNGYVL